MSTWSSNLAAYSLQVAAIVLVGVVLPWALRLRHPRALLGYWQALLAAVLVLPLVQPWHVASPAASGALGAVLVSTAVSVETAPHGTPWATVVAWVILAGACTRLAWLALGLTRLRGAVASAAPLDPLPPAIADARRRLCVSAHVRLSSRGEGPLTFGWRHPVVLLPPDVLAMPPAQQRAVACHEFVHARRGDWLFLVGEELVRAALWFHPAIWWLLERIALAREQAVDREVVELTGSRRPYLDALLRIAAAPPRPLAPAPALHRHAHLRRRIGLILQEGSMSTRRIVLSLALVTIALAATGHVVAATFPLQAAPGLSAEQSAPALSAEQPATTPPPAKYGKNDPPPRKLKHVAPAYPPEARAQGIEGMVILELTLDASGAITSVRTVKGHPLLEPAAVAAAKQWVFEPPKKAPALLTITVNFVLDKENVGARIVSDDSPGAAKEPALRPIKEVRPKYPAQARTDKITGGVNVHITVDAKGHVIEAVAVSGPEALREAAVAAAREWQFEPPGVSVKTTLEFQFVLK